jgi:hypothetical protein
MLYIAFVKNRPQSGPGSHDLTAKSRKWWNEGARPAGLKMVGFYGALSTKTPAVYVFEATSHDEIRTMIDYWNEVEFEVHPAFDMAEMFRKQGMKVA